jgi:hypothetical protein
MPRNRYYQPGWLTKLLFEMLFSRPVPVVY